ncbi:unnamed protein product, partial [Rotaria sp. Silwood1]
YVRNAITTFSQHNIRVIIRVHAAKRETIVRSSILGEDYDENLLDTLHILNENRDSKLELDCRNQHRNDLQCIYDVNSPRVCEFVDNKHRLQLDSYPKWL